MTRVGVQLHTFRSIRASVPDIIHRVASHGFDGVEFGHRLNDADIGAVKAALEDTGLEPIAAHVSMATLESEFDDLLDRYRTIGCSRIVIPHIGANRFLTERRIGALASQLNELADRLADRDFELVIHTTRGMHGTVFDRGIVDRILDTGPLPEAGGVLLAEGLGRIASSDRTGGTGFGRLVAATAPSEIAFEVDVEHAVGAGRDPHDLFELAGDRLFAIHLSDGIREGWNPRVFRSTDLGEGHVDIERDIRGAIHHRADWIIGEVDHPSDPEEAFERIARTIEPHYVTAWNDHLAAPRHGITQSGTRPDP